MRGMIDKLLEKKPEDRLQSAADVRKILEDVRDSSPSVAVPPSPAMSMDMPDTIPDVSPALAETFAATPAPESQVLDSAPKSRKSTPRIDTSTDQVQRPPRRFAIVVMFAIVPIAIVAFVFFKTMNTSSTNDSTGEPDIRTPVGSSSPDAGSGSAAVAVPLAVDAAVPDAPAPLVDAGSRPHRPRPDAGTRPHRPKPDAGAAAGSAAPDLPFYEEPKPKQ
jgi:hypothetical protein